MLRRSMPLAAAIAGGLIAVPAFATTKGLNQIVTPDVQPVGQLSLSYQQTDPNIGNREELQAEVGLTPRFEIAAFQGFAPNDQTLNAEYALYQSPHNLLSTGFSNWTSTGTAPQPFLEYGYLRGNFYGVAGIVDAQLSQTDSFGSSHHSWQGQAVLGAAYRVDPKLQLQIDYQAGSVNYSTAGFTANLSPQLTFNPAVYVGNASSHSVYGYGVLTWTVQAFK